MTSAIDECSADSSPCDENADCDVMVLIAALVNKDSMEMEYLVKVLT